MHVSSSETTAQHNGPSPGAEAVSCIPKSPAPNTTVESSGVAASGPVSASPSSRQSDTQLMLEAYLQDHARVFQDPVDVWQTSSAAPELSEEAVHESSYPTAINLSESSLAPSQAHPPQFRKRAASTVTSVSRYSSCGPPSLVYDDRTSYAESSVDTEHGNILRAVRLHEMDLDGKKPPQASNIPMYECTFDFLGCRFITVDEGDWRIHNLGHFHGHRPPNTVACPLCDSYFEGDDFRTAWEARMDHLAAHFRMGETLATSRPDVKLFCYFWQNQIINDDEYQELGREGRLSVRAHPEDLSRTTEGPHSHARRRRVPSYPKPVRVRKGISETAFLSKRGVRTLNEITTNSLSENYFCLGTEFVRFVVEELQEAEDILEVIVVTGTADRAFVAPCANYAERTWPEIGRTLLVSLIPVLKALKELKRTHDHGGLETKRDLSLGSSIVISVSLVGGLATMDKLRIAFNAQGNDEEIYQVAEILKWLSAVCRKPLPDKLSYSHVWGKDSLPFCTSFHPKPLKSPLNGGGTGHCWHNMFKGYVLAEGFPIPERGSQRGVELPFDVMTLFGLALYPINFGEGIILKGENTALIPSIYEDDENSVQWHYLEGDGAGGPLTWDRIKEHCGNIYPSKDFKLLQSKRTFVGYFPSVKVHLGTRDSGFDKVDFSGAEYDDKTAFVLGNELVGQVGTSVMNFFTAQVSGKLMVHQTAHQRLRGIHDSILDKIRNSKDLPILLFDAKTKQGWLVPELSAVLHMALAWASYQHQSAQVLSNMPFAEARPDGGMAAYDAILRSTDLLLPEHIQVGDNNDRQISARQALVPFFIRIGQIKDQQLQRHACGLKENKDLVGYEFKEIASFEEHLHLRRSKVDVDRSGGWLRLVSCKPEMAVILCSHLEAPIKPASAQRVCPLWQTVPTDQYYLTASVSCLRQLAKRCGGEENLRLYNDIYCTPSKKDPGPGVCGTRKWPCCNPLLELSKHPSKRILRFDNEGALIIGKAILQAEEHSSLRVFLRSWSNEKNGKAQNGSPSILQPNHQTLNGTLNACSPQQSASSRMP